MLFIGYPRCSTSNRAQKWLDARGVGYEFRHIADERPTQEELATWYRLSGLALKRFFNTSGRLYKELGLKDRLPGMTEDEQLALLATDGLLVKRPILIDGETVLVGFREPEWTAHFDGTERDA